MTTGQTDADLAGKSAAPATPPASAGRPWLRRALTAWSLVGLFALAYLGSHEYRGRQPHPDPALTPAPEPAKPTPEPAETASPAELLQRGDQALTRFRFAAAISLYDELRAAAPADAALIDYRLGLCHESLGILDRALASYRQALTNAPSDALALACQLGMSRCLVREGEVSLARRLFYPILLDEARQQSLPAAMLAEARFLSALAMATDGAPLAHPEALCSYREVRMEMPFYFDEIAAAKPASTPTTDKKSKATLTVRKGSDRQLAVVVHVDDNGASAAALLERVAVAGGLRPVWTEAARRAVHDRSLRLAVRDWALPDLLVTAADQVDLVCQIDEDAARFSASSELDARTRPKLPAGMRRRALEAAVRRDADHPLAPAAHLEVANELAAARDLVDAATEYENIAARYPASAAAVLGLFNRAQLHLRVQEYPRAQQSLLRVIDHAPGNDLSLRAYMQLAEICIAEEDLKQAILHCRRAVKLGPHSELQPRAVLMLSAAHLQAAEPALCRAVLVNYRSVLKEGGHRAAATVLDVYASFQMARQSGNGRRESVDLLGALQGEVQPIGLGYLGEYLRGQAFRDLGLCDDAGRVLRRAGKEAHGPFADRIELALAEIALKCDRREEAVAAFTKLAGSPSRHALQAQFELARLDLNAGRFQPCADQCRRLWDDSTFAQRPALLQVWGAALEGLGDFAKASRCYSGQPPE